MFDKRKEQELQNLSPEALEKAKKQRSLNRIFGTLVVIAVLLFAILIYEIVLAIIN